jgi:hypothetical protein
MPGGGGGKKGGGGGSSSGSIDITSTSNSVSDSQITSTSNSTNTADIDSTSNASLQIVGLDNIKVHTDAASDSKNDVRLAITEPIVTDSTAKMEMDIKPLEAQFCLKVGIERLPSTKICNPVEKHFALTLLGKEVIGFNYSEEKRTVIEDLGHRPLVISGGPLRHEHGHKHDCDGEVRIRLDD